MSKHHILVIDDDERLRLLLRRFLEESGLRVSDAGSALDARKFLDVIAFDLLVVDIMMPGETGLELLADIRQNNNVPALFLTAMSDTEHRIEGLEVGADDYMSKPFEPRELVLRIKRILARQTRLTTIASTLAFGPFLFNPETGILTRTGSRIHITTAEQQLLTSFGRAPNKVLSRDDLSAASNRRMEGRSIDVAVARLRRKIEPDPRHPVFLQTVRNRGWMLRTDDPTQGQ